MGNKKKYYFQPYLLANMMIIIAAQSGQISQRDVNQAQQIVAMSPQGQMNPMNQMNQNSMNQMNPMGQQDPIGQDPQLFLTNGP